MLWRRRPHSSGMSTSDCKVPFLADGGCGPSPIWWSQVSLERLRVSSSPMEGVSQYGSIGTLKSISSRDAAIQPSHMSKKPQALGQMMSLMEDNCPTVTSWLETWSYRFIWRMCRWHRWWKASNLLQLLVCNLHVSAPYSRTGIDARLVYCQFVSNWIFCCRHRLSSDHIVDEANPILLRISIVQQPLECWTLPR